MSRVIDPIIAVNGLSVIYNEGKSNEMRALLDVNVEIFPEEYVILYGPSGCGKSTLLYSISSLQSPTKGEVLYKNQSLTRMTEQRTLQFHQTDIGMIFQAFYLISSLNILDNVCIPQTFMGIGLEERRKKGYQLLRRFDIVAQSEKFPSELSGGQKQRVAIARSLINNPEIILADEPVGNLDTASSQNVLDILKELNTVDKKTVIMVTHNPDHLIYADRILYMKDGRIIKEEVRNDKRGANAKPILVPTTTLVPPELRLLMDSFKNLTPKQANVLLVPFKAKQLLHHLLSELSDDQVSMAEAFLRELLFKNIDLLELPERLDRSIDTGGAGWNRIRAQRLTVRVKRILEQADIVLTAPELAAESLFSYFTNLFKLSLDDTSAERLKNAIGMRLDNRVNQSVFLNRLNRRISGGGAGLRISTAAKISREMELIMLIKYSV